MVAFTPWNVDVQMSNQMKDFLSNPKKGEDFIISTWNVLFITQGVLFRGDVIYLHPIYSYPD